MWLSCVLALAAVGCSADEGPSVEARNAPAVAELRRQLDRSGEFLRLDVSYVDDFSNPEKALVSITCESCGAVTTTDRAIELVWRSDLHPLQQIRVYVEDLDADEIEARSLVLARDGAALVERYGERPGETGPTSG